MPLSFCFVSQVSDLGQVISPSRPHFPPLDPEALLK